MSAVNLYYVLCFYLMFLDLTMSLTWKLGDFKKTDNYFNIINTKNTRLKKFVALKNENRFYHNMDLTTKFSSCSHDHIKKLILKKEFGDENYVLCEIKHSQMLAEQKMSTNDIDLRENIIKYFIEIILDQNYLTKDIFLTLDSAHHIPTVISFPEKRSKNQPAIKITSNISNCESNSGRNINNDNKNNINNDNKNNINNDNKNNCIIKEDAWQHLVIKRKVMHPAKRIIIVVDKVRGESDKQRRHLFPLVKDLVVGASCKCAGKSTRCQLNSSAEKAIADQDVSHCECVDGWSGENCDYCAHGFYKTNDGQRGINSCKEGMSLVSRRRRKREACTCDRFGTYYNLCHPLAAHNYQCICKRGYSGRYCNKCSLFSYGYPSCKACDCNIFGSLISKCDDVTGKCRCREHVSGRTCDQCSHGYYRYPICGACKCPKARTKPEICNSASGACICEDNFDGENCQQCKPGYFGYPECKACSCNKIGSKSSTCDFLTGQCQCNEGFTGQNCSSCRDRRRNLPKCLLLATEKPKTDAEIILDCRITNSCPTKQPKHSFCKDLFFNDTESRVSSCVPCGCFGEGTVASVLGCDKTNGQCYCKKNVAGRACDACKDGYFDLGHDKIFGCHACRCDVGGSLNSNCDDLGNCRCRKGITGKHCNRLTNEDYFLPDHYQIKFEMEDSKLKDGSSVAYRFSEAEFPKFTWKGYISVGQEQTDLFLQIDVPKTDKYRVLFRYVLLSKMQASAIIRIYQLPIRDSPVFESLISFQVNDRSTDGQYTAAGQPVEVRLDKGQWQLHVSSNFSGLLLDHVLLMPKEYYNPNKPLQPVAIPCSVAMHRNSICSMYEYLSLQNRRFFTAKGDAGFILHSRGSTRAAVFDDPDVTRQLKLHSLAALSQLQTSVSFNITAPDTGEFVLLLQYFSTDEKVHRVDVFEDITRLVGHWVSSNCPYKFLCRSVILNSKNTPAKVQLIFGEVKTLKMVFHSSGLLGIHSITAIPSGKYTNEYLKAKFRCMMKHEKCLSYAKFADLDDSVEMKNTRNISSVNDVTYTNPGIFSTHVKNEGWAVVVVLFRQSKYPEFIAQLTFTSLHGSTRLSLRLEFCPSEAGCRVKARLYAKRGELRVKVTTPRKRDFKIDSVYLVPNDKFSETELELHYPDVSAEFLRICVNENRMPIRNTFHSLCRDAFFSQISAFNNGASFCNCHPRGSNGRKCQKNGGQCECKKNIIGRSCQSCRAGFYNFPNCRNCRCFMAGSLSPECNRNGKCKCKPQYGGSKCNKCKSSHFYAFPECKPCNCNTHGSLGLYCDATTGQCLCLTNFRTRSCNKCEIGFHSFPNCSKCQCNAAGIAFTKYRPNVCTPGADGRCSCKQHVAGALCDRCKDLYFNLQITNPLGCTPCKCDTAGTLNGIATCAKDSGKCPCKTNVETHGRTCDTCKDGFYGLSRNNIFGCSACLCDNGGSISHVCDKKSGQCRCRPNIAGKKCDRLMSDSYYIPTIQHLSFDAEKGVNKYNNLLTPSRSDQNKNKNDVRLKISVPKTSKYLLIFGYKHAGFQEIEVDISIIYSLYQSVVYKLKQRFKSSSLNSSAIQVSPLRKNSKELFLNLFQGSYEVKLSANTFQLSLEYISLIPEDYLTGKSLSSPVQEPCSVYDNSRPCIRYAYLNVPRKGVFTIELESMRRSGGELFDQSKYPTLNINGAILLRYEQTFTISFEQAASGSFIFLLQYFYLYKSSARLLINLQGPEGLQTGIAQFARCPYVFSCSQSVLDGSGKLQQFRLQKGAKYHVSFSLMTIDEIALDLLAMIPDEKWNFDFINPTPFCISVNQKCIKSELTFTDDHVALQASKCKNYRKPQFLPPNIFDASLKLLHIKTGERARQVTIRWSMPLKRGRFFPLLHYYQPYDKTVVIKFIIHTLYNSVAGKLRLAFCPHVSGCRAPVLQEGLDSNSNQAIYISGSNVGITLSLPMNFNLWLSHLLFIRTYTYEEQLLTEKSISLSQKYKENCLQFYETRKPVTKNCWKWLFQVTMSFNSGPFKCNCKIQGSKQADCDLIGGQCECKDHVIGRTCSMCIHGYSHFPRCLKGKK